MMKEFLKEYIQNIMDAGADPEYYKDIDLEAFVEYIMNRDDIWDSFDGYIMDALEDAVNSKE